MFETEKKKKKKIYKKKLGQCSKSKKKKNFLQKTKKNPTKKKKGVALPIHRTGGRATPIGAEQVAENNGHCFGSVGQFRDLSCERKNLRKTQNSKKIISMLFFGQKHPKRAWTRVKKAENRDFRPKSATAPPSKGQSIKK